MRAHPTSSRTLFLLVLVGIASVFGLGRLLMSAEVSTPVEAGIVSAPAITDATPAEE